MATEPITRDQIGCARCWGEGHEGIIYMPLTYPIAFGDPFRSIATHWAPCPTNGEPILWVVMDKKKKVYRRRIIRSQIHRRGVLSWVLRRLR